MADKCLIKAVKDGNIKYIEKYLDIFDNAENVLNSCITCAIKNGCIDIVNKFIVECQRYLNGWLTCAFKSGNMVLVKMMLDKGAYMFTEHIHNNLDNACYGGNIDLVKLILNDSSCNSDFIKCANMSEYHASKGGHAHIIKFLSEKKRCSMKKILWGACRGGHMKLFKFKYNQMIVKNCLKKEQSCPVNWILDWACFGGNIDIIEFLIENGANDWNNGLYYACKGSHMDIVQFLIEKGANNWNKGLWGACAGGNMDIVQLMVKKGANDWKGAKDSFKKACKNGYTDIVKLMIKNGHVNTEEWIIRDIIRDAYERGHIDLVIFFIEEGMVMDDIDYILKILDRYRLFEKYTSETVDQLGLCQDINGLIKEYIL